MRDKTKLSLYFEDEELRKQTQNMTESVFGSRVIVTPAESLENWKDELLVGEGFDILVVESSMKNQNPRDFVDGVFDLAGEKAVLVIGTDSMNKSRFQGDLYEEQEHIQFVKTPLKIDDLGDAIRKLMEWSNQQKMDASVIEASEDEFLPMRLRNFYLYKELEYDAYLQITSKKYVAVISKGVRYYSSDIRKLAKSQVRYLYLRKEDRLAFMEKTLEKLSETLQKPVLDFDVVFKIQSQTVTLVHEYLLNIGVTKDLVKLARDLITKTDATYTQLGSLELIISKFPFEGYLVSDQSMVIAYIANAIAGKMGWESTIVKSKLGLAALIHDCTLINDDLARIAMETDPNLMMFTDAEKKNFMVHSHTASQFCNLFSGFPECDFLVEEHHELPDGSGFPKGISASKISVLSAVFALSCQFAAELIQRGRKKETMLRTLANFEPIYKQGAFKEPFLALKTLLS